MKTDVVILSKIDEAVQSGKVVLDEFEKSLLGSVRTRLDQGRELSVKQRQALDKIQAKIGPW